jgi:hypothetical protein
MEVLMGDDVHIGAGRYPIDAYQTLRDHPTALVMLNHEGLVSTLTLVSGVLGCRVPSLILRSLFPFSSHVLWGSTSIITPTMILPQGVANFT